MYFKPASSPAPLAVVYIHLITVMAKWSLEWLQQLIMLFPIKHLNCSFIEFHGDFGRGANAQNTQLAILRKRPNHVKNNSLLNAAMKKINTCR